MREGGGIQVRSRGQICWMRWQRGEGAKETGIDNVWKIISEYLELVKSNNYFDEKRQTQNQFWMMETINEQLKNHFHQFPSMDELLKNKSLAVQQGKISPFKAANDLLDFYFKSKP